MSRPPYRPSPEAVLHGNSDSDKPITELRVKLRVYHLHLDAHVDTLSRSSDPYLRTRLKNRIRTLLAAGGQEFKYALPLGRLADLARIYGEQYVEDPWSDIQRYFDVVSKRLYTRPIPTQQAILFLFGSGKPYRPNLGTLSAAGEAVAGFCLEAFGYQPLVRPIGIMPDALMWARKPDGLRLALCESKASVGDSPTKMIQDEAHQFLVDIKTRTVAFSRNHYEAYLVCSTFIDGGEVEVGCLYMDLGAFQNQAADPLPLGLLDIRVSTRDEPRVRLQQILRVQADTLRAHDEYLASLLSEEATRTAAVAMFRENRQPNSIAEVDQFIMERAREAGVEREWMESQTIIGDNKDREHEFLKSALRRYKNPKFDEDKSGE